jgi:uncharacterized protein with HEPN domain
MSRDPQRLPDYLGHILEAIERIQHYVDAMDEVGFLGSKLVQDAVIRNLEVIGEASRNIERAHPDFAAAHPELPLALANDMRNALSHGYFKVDLGIVWGGEAAILWNENQKFRYVLPFDAVADGLDDPLRVRWPGTDPQLADLPDKLQTYTDSRQAAPTTAAPPPKA